MAGTVRVFALIIVVCQVRLIDASFQPALVMDMAKILLENYCFPENLVGMQEAIQQAISSGEILHISDRKTLAAVLTAGVQGALNDPRLTVSYEPNYIPITPPALQSLPMDQLMRLIRNTVKLEVMDNNIGYLRIDRIIGQETAAKLGRLLHDNIWMKVAHTSAMIFDLRFSTAGEISGVPYIVSYFSDSEPLLHIDTIYERPPNTTKELWTLPNLLGERYGKRKELIVLISKRTTGAAEAVAYILKHLRRAIIVGEKSAGGSVKVEKLRVGDSGFYITVPVARSVNPVTGQSWEVTGVSPSITVNPKEGIAKAKSLIAVRNSILKAVKRVSDIIKRFYAFKDKIPVLLNHLAKTDFFPVISEEDLAARLNYELQSVFEDPRLKIMTLQGSSDKGQELDAASTTPSSFVNLNNPLFKLEILSGNIGYLRFDRFPTPTVLMELEDKIKEKVWQPVRDTENLIIDLRFNTGGSTEALPIMLSYMFDASSNTHLFSIYDSIGNVTIDFHTLRNIIGPSYGSRKGIYVLTSYYTAEAGEEFAYLMQSLHRGTVVGEITSGMLLHSRTFPIEETSLRITIPVMNFIDKHGECWLGGGVVPDAIVLAEDAVERAHEIIAFHKDIPALLQEAGDLLEKHYTVPEVAAKVSRQIQSKLIEGLYRSVIDYESLASQLTADLQETSGDHRLHIFNCEIEPESLQTIPKIPSPEEVGFIIDALFKVEVLAGNIGYLRSDMMEDFQVLRAIGPELVKVVWNKLVNTDMLIIDLRYNTGGYSTAIPLLCTYFFDAQPLKHLYTISDHSERNATKVMTLPQVLGQRYGSHKDMYILTSQITGSAAEAFTRTMKDLKRATIIGEPTIGGALSSGTYQIGNSILYASIPNRAVLSAVSGKAWSVSGVEPHIAAQASNALNVAQKIISAKHQKKKSGK
ncbi:retinol-binding protein 3-like [Carassius carassius]|uniref:retinol-binding protein 3-like n=1 Tax=Carassius carassius TaxID=217509 RepID=UPI002868F2BF|nr:retinol-binding protein 3-like [Carassius carassius]